MYFFSAHNTSSAFYAKRNDGVSKCKSCFEWKYTKNVYYTASETSTAGNMGDVLS